MTGACYHALQNDGENMSEKDETKNEPIEEEPVIEDKSNDDAGLSEAQTNQVKDIFNELSAEFEPRILEILESKLNTIAESAADKAATAVAERILAEMKATEEVTSDDKDLNSEEGEDDEDVEPEVIETEEQSSEDETKSEPGIAEPEEDDEPETKDESEEESESEEEEDEVPGIDEKHIDELVHQSIVKQMNEKSIKSKFDQFRKSSKKHTPELDEKSMNKYEIKRDNYGRNLDYV